MKTQEHCIDELTKTAKKFDIQKLMENAKKRRQREIKNLESSSKQLNELIVAKNFIVKDVVAESYEISFTPYSELVIGGSSPTYFGGFTSKLVLKVSPDNPNIPVKTLNFHGISAVRTGDYITAQIPRFKEKRVMGEFNDEDRIFYFNRDFNSEESAIELVLLSSDGKVLRRERSVHYRSFVKE